MSFPMTKKMFMERPLPMKLVERLAREMSSPTVLSEREMDVLALFACGCNGREIAGILHLSPWTIQSHQKKIRMKLNARTMAHAVALALLHGNISADLIE